MVRYRSARPARGAPFSRERRFRSDRTLRLLTRDMLAARLRAGLTQAQVAQRLATHKSAISRLENGLSRPTLATIQNYALVVGCVVEVRLTPVADALSGTRPRTDSPRA